MRCKKKKKYPKTVIFVPSYLIHNVINYIMLAIFTKIHLINLFNLSSLLFHFHSLYITFKYIRRIINTQLDENSKPQLFRLLFYLWQKRNKQQNKPPSFIESKKRISSFSHLIYCGYVFIYLQCLQLS